MAGKAPAQVVGIEHVSQGQRAPDQRVIQSVNGKERAQQLAGQDSLAVVCVRAYIIHGDMVGNCMWCCAAWLAAMFIFFFWMPAESGCAPLTSNQSPLASLDVLALIEQLQEVVHAIDLEVAETGQKSSAQQANSAHDAHGAAAPWKARGSRLLLRLHCAFKTVSSTSEGSSFSRRRRM